MSALTRAVGQGRALADVIAGISVALVLIPQSLAYAELAGLPPHLGLYAAGAAPILAAFFASSNYLQTGPTAMTSLLTFGALTSIAAVGSPEYVALAPLLALLVGAIRVILGLLRSGAIANFLSQPVILGFTIAAALLIFASQLPTALGVNPPAEGVTRRAWHALTHPGTWDPASMVITALSLVVFFGGRRIHALFPGVLIAVIAGLVFSVLTDFGGLTIGHVPEPRLPDLSMPFESVPSLLLPALLIALIGFAEPASISRTFAAMDRSRWDPNREMISQGVANLASGLSGAFPVGGSFSRSALGRMAGTRTRWAGAVTGATVLAFLPFATMLEPLPKAILGAIVIASVLKLMQFGKLFGLFRFSKPQAGIAVSTFLLTLLLEPHVEYAILAGVGLSILVHAWRELGVRVQSDWNEEAGTLTLCPHGVLWFASAPFVEEHFNALLSRHTAATRLVLDLGGLGRIDYTGALAVKGLMNEAKLAGLEVEVVEVPPQCEGLLGRVCGI